MEGIINAPEQASLDLCRLCRPIERPKPTRDVRVALEACTVDQEAVQAHTARAFQQLRDNFPKVIKLDREIFNAGRANIAATDNLPSSPADNDEEDDDDDGGGDDDDDPMYSLTGQIDGIANTASSFAFDRESFLPSPTRPNPVLRTMFAKNTNVLWLTKLWYPTNATEWCLALLNTLTPGGCYYNYQLRADVLLAAARFGEAQLYGSPDRVMLTTLVELETGVCQPFKEWRRTLLSPYSQRSGGRARGGYTMGHDCGTLDCGERDFLIVHPEKTDGFQLLIVNGMRLPHLAQEGMRQLSNLIREYRIGKVIERRKQAIRGYIDVMALVEHDQQCSICFERTDTRCETWCKHDFKTRPHHHPVKTTCGHIFGLTCLDDWLYSSRSCPTCRRVLYATGRCPRLYEGVGFRTFSSSS